MAAQKVLKKMDNVRFVMAGSGELLEKMIHWTSSLGISDRFHYTGFLRGDDVFRMFSITAANARASASPLAVDSGERMFVSIPRESITRGCQ